MLKLFGLRFGPPHTPLLSAKSLPLLRDCRAGSRSVLLSSRFPLVIDLRLYVVL